MTQPKPRKTKKRLEIALRSGVLDFPLYQTVKNKFRLYDHNTAWRLYQCLFNFLNENAPPAVNQRELGKRNETQFNSQAFEKQA